MSGYYRILKDMEKAGNGSVCSGQLGEAMHCAPSQVRQDFSFFGSFGITGKGYATGELRQSVERVLGVDRRHSAILIGAGHIGTHMLRNNTFADCGFEIKAAFDISPDVIGSGIGGVLVRDMRELDAFLEEGEITMAALCVPRGAAQAAADAVCAHGVMAIWNITGCNLEVPRDVVLEELSLSDSFLALSYHLAHKRVQEEQQSVHRKADIYRIRDDYYNRGIGSYAIGQSL